MVRVTDPAGNCGAGTTALSWDQNGWKGYGYIKADGTLDVARSKNVVSVTQSTVDPSYFCLNLNGGNPLLISTTGQGPTFGGVRGADYDNQIDQVCSSSTNAIVGLNGSQGQIYFFFR